MNLSKFIIAVKKNLSKLKGITRLPGFKYYVILALALTALFTVFTFPFEIIALNQLKKMEGKNFRNITVEQMNISLLKESHVENLTVTLMNGSSISIKNLTANISFIRLIRKNFSGSIKAAKIAYSSGQLEIECAVDSNLELKMDESLTIPSDGKIEAIIENARISVSPELVYGFSLPQPMRVSSININSNIINRLLTIKDFVVSGNDISGKITGNVTLTPILGNSKLNLTILPKPDSSLLDMFRFLLKQFTDTSGKILIPLSGTLAHLKLDSVKLPNKGSSEIPPFETDPER